MAKKNSASAVEIPQDRVVELENFLAEGDPDFVKTEIPVADDTPAVVDEPENHLEKELQPEVKEVVPTAEKVTSTKEPSKTEKTPDADTPEEFLLELEPETTSVTEPDWDFVAKETGIEAKGKDNVIAELKRIKSENEELKSQVEKVKDYGVVSQQVATIDSLLSLDAEQLVRKDMKDIKGWDDEDIERSIQKMIDNDTLDDRYMHVKYELKNLKSNIIQNASKIRQEQEQASTLSNQKFAEAIKESIKSISTIYGLSFSDENLKEVHSRAERISSSKEFQDELRNPKTIAELSFRKALGGSLEKMIRDKFRNQGKNEILSQFENRTPRTTKGVEKPQSYVDKETQKNEMEEFVNSTDFRISR